MAIKIGDKSYDSANISGVKLAEIGRAVVSGQISVNPIVKKKFVARSDVIDYESLRWLDTRIEEVCSKGKV